MSRSQRDKGHAWERRAARMLRETFPGTRRGLQARDGHDAPDVQGTPFWVECKVGARPGIEAAMRQALAAAGRAGDKRAPVAITKRDGEAPLATMLLDDWIDLVTEWVERGR